MKQEESLLLQSCVRTVELESVSEDTYAHLSDYGLEIKELKIQNS